VRLPSLLSAVLAGGLLLSACGADEEQAQSSTSPSSSGKQAQSPSASSSASMLVPFDGDGFSASMPTAPQRRTQEVPTVAGPVTAVFYLSQTGTSAYIVSYVDLPNGQGDLPGAIAGAAQNVGGSVREEKETIYNGFPARDARITGASGGRGTAFVRVLLANGRLYQLQYVQEGGNVTAPPAVYRQFLDSLRID
jgi:hypothetical protein